LADLADIRTTGSVADLVERVPAKDPPELGGHEASEKNAGAWMSEAASSAAQVLERPVAEQQALERPVAERQALEGPVVERQALLRPALERPVAERPVLERQRRRSSASGAWL